MTRRVAFVTGAARGIGLAIARALQEAGHRVALADIDLEAAEAAAQGLAGEGLAGEGRAPAVALALDVRDRSSVEHALGACAERLGPVEILVNNAALTRARPFLELTAQEWDEVMAVNLRGMLFTGQVAAPGMIERGFGRIINLASLSGQRGGPQVQGLHYAASKAAIIGLTRGLAHELAPHGVTVNAIAPGPVVTDQTALVPPEKLAALGRQIPVGRFGEAAEVGALAAYLASDVAGFVTGATFDINGGVLMR